MGTVGIDGTWALTALTAVTAPAARPSPAGHRIADGRQHAMHRCAHDDYPHRPVLPQSALPASALPQSQLCGALCRNRTDDLFLTMEMLYRLS